MTDRPLKAAMSTIATATCLVPLLASFAFAQQGGFDPERMAREALAEPFVGITADGTPEEGLFAIGGTGVPTAPVIEAADAFIASLSEAQRKRTLFPVDDPEWRTWANIHRFERQGVSLQDMSETQRDSAYALLRASLSAKGYETSRDIMRLNEHLAELVDNFDEYGEHRYAFTIMGEPSASDPWGWQIDGHHLVINYFVLGDQVVMTPTFLGSEPVEATSGKYAGISILRPEQDLGLALMQALPPEQQKAAIIGDKGRGELLAGMFTDNITVPFEGLAATELSEAHRQSLLEVIALHVGNMDDGHARVRMDEVRDHLDETTFAWKGGTADDAVFYYRIQSPVILIEFDHQGPIALDGPRSEPTRRHVHTVVRTPNGNDYGKDLLRQHYEAIEHEAEHGSRKP
ncbi:MAG: DUF3500 domain-containing protein [Alphaproteobacteria bacterium]